ncbi:MAG: hypothetical protein K5908_02655 [Erysipelotrichaceae bacterium]|jgi:hypothetical protein|nr:hypothetical protein [Erysipelotrichaceae bacterium]
MEFGWINVFGAVIVILMMVPNIIYVIKNRDEKNKCTDRFMNVIEQIGRYACIILMWMPLLIWKFGFSSVFEMILYLMGNGCLLAAYWIIFISYLRRKTRKRALALAVLPTCIFLLSGLLLHHWLLVIFALLFGIGHIYVTQKNVSVHE